MTPDELEAESSKHALGIRVLRLSSGAWAYFQDFRLLAITPTLEETRLQLYLSIQADEYEAECFRARQPKPKLTGDQLLKELGL